MKTLQTLKAGDTAYHARWSQEEGETRIVLKCYVVTACTPKGFHARQCDTVGYKGLDVIGYKHSSSPWGKSSWYGYSTRILRPTIGGAIERMNERTMVWRNILTRQLSDCNERIRATDAGEFSFPNNISEW
jgi:hypothetical protein